MYNLDPKTRKEHLMGKISGNPNAEEITDPRTREEYFLKDIEEAAGGGSAPFVVTLTPTAADMSGTMDRTVGEIYEAYQAGKRIVFKVDGGNGSYTYADCTMQYIGSSAVYPSFNGFIIDNARNILIFAYTGARSSATTSTYSATIYTLARAT